MHRDIKPQNLLIDGDGQVKLCDFGIATLTADDRYRTCTNAVSMRYSSPEDLEHDDPVGPAADVYSLGATLLHLVHGAPPTLRDRLTPWEPPATRDPDLAALDAVIAACLDPDPARRPTAEELLQSLDDCVLDSGRKGVCELPVVDRVVPLITLDDVPIDLHEALTLQPPSRPGEAIELERPLMLDPTKGRRFAPRRVSQPQPPRPPSSCSSWERWSPSVRSRRVTQRKPQARSPPPAHPALAPLVDADWSSGSVGDCLAQLTNTTQLKVTTCDTPHDLQRYHQASLPPDVKAAEAASRRHRMRQRLRSRSSARSRPTSDLDIAQTLPITRKLANRRPRTSSATWASKDDESQAPPRDSGW